MNALVDIISTLNINGYALIASAMALAILFGIWKANSSESSSFELEDLVCDIDITTGKKTASITKILQAIGGITGTFIVIKLTLQNSLTWDIFVTYMAYVASIDGFSKYLLARYSKRD